MASFELLTRLWQLGSVVAKTSAACLESAFGKGCCGFANFASKTVFPSKTSKSCGRSSIGMDGLLHLTGCHGVLWEWISPYGVGAESSIAIPSNGKSRQPYGILGSSPVGERVRGSALTSARR